MFPGIEYVKVYDRTVSQPEWMLWRTATVYSFTVGQTSWCRGCHVYNCTMDKTGCTSQCIQQSGGGWTLLGGDSDCDKQWCRQSGGAGKVVE